MMSALNKRYAQDGLKIMTLLTGWLAVIAWLGHMGVFQSPENTPPGALLVAVIVPPSLFWLRYHQSSRLQKWVQTIDLATVTIVQTWRVIGVTFLFLWGLGQLPGVFAAPAGLGDLAVGIFAAFVTLDIVRRSANWRRLSYWLIVIGMLDFIVALSSAMLSSPGRPLALVGAPDPELMQQLPMVLIPAYGVPLFIIFHLIAWLKLRSE